MSPTTELIPTIRIKNVSKRFPGVVANDDVSLDILPGTVHCLLGENGAGKSTLAGIIYGVQRPDEGVIQHNGHTLDLRSPSDAIAAGIGMVHQHFELVTPMSTVENVLLGTSDSVWLNTDDVRHGLEDLCSKYDVDIDLDAPVGELSVGQQQWVEILKVMYMGVDVLILDEPTAVLTPAGVQRLLEALRRMTESGLAVVLISHKLDEVMSASDRITVLRRGKVVETVATDDVTAAGLTAMMVGRDVKLSVTEEFPVAGGPTLEVRDLHVATPTGRGALRGIDLVVHEHEILGIAGISGNGQKALFDSLVGVRKPETGTIMIDGVDVTGEGPSEISARGVGSVPSDRINEGLMMDFSVRENLILGRHRNAPFARAGVLNRGAIESFAEEAFRDFEIAAPSASHITRVLSGGNLQKVVMARELAGNPRVLIVHQPTRGLDIAASDYVRRSLLAERDRGAAILLMSEDLDEIMGLSTRIVVLHGGLVMGEVPGEDADVGVIGGWMAGAQTSGEKVQA